MISMKIMAKQKILLQMVLRNNIPYEDSSFLSDLSISPSMEFHSPVPFDHFDNARVKSDPNEFHSEEYLEYRRRVFDELASEYNKFERNPPRYESDIINEIPDFSPTSPIQHEFPSYYSVDRHSANNTAFVLSIGDAPGDISPTQQPTWDDSDLLLEPESHEINDNGLNRLLAATDLYEDEHNDRNENTSTDIPTMHWTELEMQLQAMTELHENRKSNDLKPHSQFSPLQRKSKSSFSKQKNDRETIRQKLSMADPEVDSGEKTWCHPRAERRYSGNSQNLQICYINDSCSSSDNDENQSKLSPSFTRHPSTGSKTSPTSSPVLSSPGFGIRKSFTPYRMSSSSSTISLTSNSSTGHHTSSSSLPADGEIISMRSNLHSEDTKKPRTRQEELELEARIALTQAHQKARKQAKEERNRNRRGSVSSLERILHIPLDDATRLKIRNRNLTREDCEIMTNGQLQVILNDMHAEKEALNSNLMSILETREDLRTQQDAKLIDIEDFKAMMSVSGPETTV